MTFAAAEPVASGQSYLITEVNGRPPGGLGDFTGAIQVTAVKDGQHLTLVGAATQTQGVVRFYQKDPGPDDRDVRVWTIVDQGSGSFLGQPLAAF
jgi:hypothetical protein